MTAPIVIDAIKRASAAIAAKRIYTKKLAEVPVTVGTQAIGSTIAENPLFKNPSLPPIPEQALVPAPKPVDNQQSVPPGIAASAEPAKPAQNAPAPQNTPAVPPAQTTPAVPPAQTAQTAITPGMQQGAKAVNAPDNAANIARNVQPGVTPPTEAVTPDRIVNDYFIANKGAGISEKGITEYAAKTYGPDVDARSALAQHIQNKLLAPIKPDEKGNINFTDLADARAKLLSIAKDPTTSPEMKEWAQEAIAKESDNNAARNLTPEQQKSLQTQTFKKLLDYTSDAEILAGAKQHLQNSKDFGSSFKLKALSDLEAKDPGQAAELARNTMKSDASIQAVADKVLEEANKAANASAESINKAIDDLVEKDPKGSGFWDLLSSVDSASWGNIALVGGLVMMVFGGDTGKLIGGLSMLAGGYNLYQRYNQLQTPETTKAFKAVLEQSKTGAIDYESLLKDGYSPQAVQGAKDIILLSKLGLKDKIKEQVSKKAQGTMGNFFGKPPAQPAPGAV
jgi:hypothetical protein